MSLGSIAGAIALISVAFAIYYGRIATNQANNGRMVAYTADINASRCWIIAIVATVIWLLNPFGITFQV